jgi:hypothetical protein
LLNPVGKVVGTWKTQDNVARYSVAGLPGGLYYVRIIQQNGRVSTRKLMVLK